MIKKIGFFISTCILSSQLSAQLLVNEIKVNPPGTDNPYEYIELRGQPNTTLINTYFVIFEGDSGSAGNADLVIPLSGITLGENGLLFIGTSLGYTNINSQTIFKDSLLFGIPSGSIENGSSSFITLFSPSPILTNVNYDLNNDGVLDLSFGTSIIDAIGFTNNNEGAKVYGGVNITQNGFTPDAIVRFYDNTTPSSSAAWYCGDLAGSANTINFDLAQVSFNFPSGGIITPAEHNFPNSLSIAPTLATNYFQFNAYDKSISLPKHHAGVLQMFDLMGRVVFTENIQAENQLIALPQNATGVMLITFTENNVRYSQKILIQ